MGLGYDFKCRKCGYKFDAIYGVGMLFPYEYEKKMEEGRRGELGEKVKHFLEEHPDGVLDISMTAMQCRSCGKYASRMKLNMYLPKENAAEKRDYVRWSVAVPAEDVDYVDPDDLPGGYRLARRYTHICGDCGGKMKYVREEVCMEGLECPKCHSKMDCPKHICWD